MTAVGEVMELVTELRLETSKFKSQVAESQNRIVSFASFASKALLAIGSAGIAIEAFRKFHEMLSESEKKVNDVYLATKKVGVGVEQFEGLEFAASKFNVSGQQVVSTLQFMQRAIGQAQAGTGQAGGVLKALGLDVNTLASESPDKELVDISKALQTVKDRSQEAYAGSVLLGRGFRQAMGFVNSDISGGMQEFQKLGVGLTDGQVLDVHKLEESKNTLDHLWDGFKNQVTADVAPAITQFIEQLNQAAENGSIKKIAAGFAEGITGGIKLATSALQIYIALQDKMNIGRKWVSDILPVVPDINGNDPIHHPLITWFDGIKEGFIAAGNLVSEVRQKVESSPSFQGTTLQKYLSTQDTTVTSGPVFDVSTMSTAAKDAGAALKDLAGAAKKAKDDAFSTGLKSNPESKKLISDIISDSRSGSSLWGNADTTEFKEKASTLLQFINAGGGKDSHGQRYVNNTLSQLQGSVDIDNKLGYNTRGEQGALDELKKFVQNQGIKGTVQVNIKVTPNPQAYIEAIASGQGIQIINGHIENYTHSQAQAVHN